MEFLKEILGAELYAQVAEKINAHNGNEANKENQIKIANLAAGEYVGKGKFDALQETLNGKDTEIMNANKLIAELKNASKGDAEMQAKFQNYEQENERLQAELHETEVKYAFELLLMDSGVTDKEEREFLAYKYEKKLKEDGKALELDENKHIKGADAIIESMKTMRPTAFEAAGTGKLRVLGDGKLPEGDGGDVTVTREQFLKMGYSDRLKLKQENETLYKQLSKN